MRFIRNLGLFIFGMWVLAKFLASTPTTTTEKDFEKSVNNKQSFVELSVQPNKKADPLKLKQAVKDALTTTSPKRKVGIIETRYVDADRLNVRSGPDKGSKVVWTLKRDEQVKIEKVEGDWSYLVSDRYKGWVFSTYLTKTPSPEPAKQTVKKSKPTLSTAAIKQILIKRSLSYYSGSCPCPYNVDRGGRSCGRRSAYSRPGGASPLCFPGDITSQMVEAYRAREE